MTRSSKPTGASGTTSTTIPPERDDKGCLTYTGLVPGLPYVLATFEGFDFRKGMPRVDFTVKPGETLKLPDFVIGK